MKVFISWSKNISKQIASELKELVEYIFQGADVFLSLSNIDSGARWGSEIATKLTECDYGLLCLTHENLKEPWLLFEAGAISKAADSRVVPLLFGVSHTDLDFPLKQFQARQFSEDEFLTLFKDMNSHLGQLARTEERISKIFEKFWPDFRDKTQLVLREPAREPGQPANETNEQKLLRIVSESQNQLVGLSARIGKIEKTMDELGPVRTDFLSRDMDPWGIEPKFVYDSRLSKRDLANYLRVLTGKLEPKKEKSSKESETAPEGDAPNKTEHQKE